MVKLITGLLIVLFVVTGCATLQQPPPFPGNETGNTTNQMDNQTNTTTDLRAFAEQWIRDAPTYAADGTNLTFISSTVAKSNPPQYDFVFTFVSSSGGYGRAREPSVGFPVLHQVSLTIINEQVTSAVIDSVWDELQQRMLTIPRQAEIILRIEYSWTVGVEELHITNGSAIYLHYSHGNLTQRAEKSLTATAYATYMNSFNQNNFSDLEASYHYQVYDANSGSITLIADGNNQTVTMYPYRDARLPRGLLNIIDELQQLMDKLRNTSETLTFTPMQCIQTPWDAWLENESIRFIRAPSQDDIIRMYYAQKNIGILALTNETQDGATCLACEICSTGISWHITIAKKDVPALLADGWKRNA